ncbi:hypothetical protein [Paraburkholderia sp. BR14320]|uniref:hypothetical protein n=1 Tax=unclassified Paraburkholderia TaxID=2615204 RepID=UPI0034CDB235
MLVLFANQQHWTPREAHNLLRHAADHQSEPGRLLCDDQLQLPWHPAAAKLRVNAPALRVRGPRRNTTLGPVRGRSARMMAPSLQNSPSGELQAQALADYPLRGMGRGARLQRREPIG